MSNHTCNLIIGGIGIRIESPSTLKIKLTRGCTPFIGESQTVAAAGVLRLSDATAEPLPALGGMKVVATGFNDLGASRLYYDGGNRYIVGISPRPGEEMRLMAFGESFREGRLWLTPGDRWNSFILDSMLRIFFSQIAVLEDAFLLHASAVMTPAGVHLFMGQSGTGKSTHSRLWMGSFGDCRLLNDDNPLVRLLPDGVATACGTPWSGKTPCWVNASGALLSMTRLRQAPTNRYTPRSEAMAVITALPGVSVIAHCRELYNRMLHTLGAVTSAVRVGELQCRPDGEAATLCRHMAEGTV